MIKTHLFLWYWNIKKITGRRLSQSLLLISMTFFRDLSTTDTSMKLNQLGRIGYTYTWHLVNIEIWSSSTLNISPLCTLWSKTRSISKVRIERNIPKFIFLRITVIRIQILTWNNKMYQKEYLFLQCLGFCTCYNNCWSNCGKR